MKIKPLFDYIVVDTKEKAETTKSGFILPSASADKYATAKAVAVGKGTTSFGNHVEMEVKAGDVVLYPVGTAVTVKVDGEEATLIRQSDVLAIIG